MANHLRAFDDALVIPDGDEQREVFGAGALNAQDKGRDGQTIGAYLCEQVMANGALTPSSRLFAAWRAPVQGFSIR